MSLLRKLVHFLTHDPALERARSERARIEAALDTLADRESSPLLALVRQTLFHQGEPRAIVERLLEVLRTGRSYAWDEADYEIEGERDRVTFLGETVETDRATLEDLLVRIRIAIEG